MTAYFGPALFKFLTELEANNDREWFKDNRDRYLADVQEPALAFITDFGPRLARISSHFRADPRANGGSLFRIHRDTRFGPDKTPYKTNTGVHFRHERSRDVHAPGYYLHLEPSACFAGVGMWHPEPAVANRIRRSIHDDPGAWKKAAKSKRFADVWSTQPDDDEMLKRVPRDLDPTHPYADDLRMKSFIAGRSLTQREVTGPSFIDEFEARCRAASPYMSFLCDAVGVEF